MALWKKSTSKTTKQTTETKNAEKKEEVQKSAPHHKVLTAEGFKRRLLNKKP